MKNRAKWNTADISGIVFFLNAKKINFKFFFFFFLEECVVLKTE